MRNLWHSSFRRGSKISVEPNQINTYNMSKKSWPNIIHKDTISHDFYQIYNVTQNRLYKVFVKVMITIHKGKYFVLFLFFLYFFLSLFCVGKYGGTGGLTQEHDSIYGGTGGLTLEHGSIYGGTGGLTLEHGRIYGTGQDVCLWMKTLNHQTIFLIDFESIEYHTYDYNKI